MYFQQLSSSSTTSESPSPSHELTQSPRQIHHLVIVTEALDMSLVKILAVVAGLAAPALGQLAECSILIAPDWPACKSRAAHLL